MLPDVQKYMRYFDGLAISDSEKEDLVRALWATVEQLVDRVLDGSLTVEADPKDEGRPAHMIELPARICDRDGLAKTFRRASTPSTQEGPQDE